MTPSPDARPAAAPAVDPLAALRAEIDTIDDALHDLLMRRAAVVARLAASRVKGAAASPLRPGREAAILRRLLARHAGPLPPAALVRLWREILAASSAMQGDFVVSLPAGDAATAAAARIHFGALASLRPCPGPEAALAALAAGEAQAAVLPLPAADGPGAWWAALDGRRAQVVARLPFFAADPAAPGALVLSGAGPDPSGDDRSLLRLSFRAGPPAPSRAGVLGALAAAGFAARDALPRGDGACRWLATVDGAVSAGDPRFSALGLRPSLGAAEPLGFYATPVRAAAPARGE